MKTLPFLKAAALAALLVPLPADAQQSDRAGNNSAAIVFLRQALSWQQKTLADVANVPCIAGIADIASLTALLKQVVESLSAA